MNVARLEEQAAAVEDARLAALRRGMTRDQAVFRAGQLAADVAVRRGESANDRESRVARARAYAAWEWDGKPAGASHLEEFGVEQQERPAAVFNGSDFKNGKTH